MDINDVRGLATVFALIAFLGVVYWAYGSSRKQRFDEDAQLPFADDDIQPDIDDGTKTDSQDKTENNK